MFQKIQGGMLVKLVSIFPKAFFKKLYFLLEPFSSSIHRKWTGGVTSP